VYLERYFNTPKDKECGLGFLSRNHKKLKTVSIEGGGVDYLIPCFSQFFMAALLKCVSGTL